ncbi:MAG: glycosyltransferase [Gammaproteobacteria bacterium]|nr:hypothetical protein [Gammaproteobacteria bacterium]
MKVYYHRVAGGNVGDDMNAVLWSTLLPSLDTLATADWLIGAGTIIDARLNSLPGRKVVMGSGFRPGSKPATWGDDMRFAAVRGYLSAAQCGLEPDVAVCDPGFLVTRAWRCYGTARGGAIGFVPHVYSERYSAIAAAAADAGFEVVSPTLDIESFLQRLARCARVYTESLHGAIFADALRIPWARIHACSIYYEGDDVANFKWADAFSVLGLDSSAINSIGLLPIKRSWSRARAALRPLQALAEQRLIRSLRRRQDDERLFRLSDTARLEERQALLLERLRQLESASCVRSLPTARTERNRMRRAAHRLSPLRVAAFPKQNENAFLRTFASSLERRGAIVDDFSFRRVLLRRYDVVHMHWPDTHLRTHSWWRALAKHLRLGVTCAVLRARNTRIVWMMHNLQPHEKDHWISRSLFRWWFPRTCTHVMALTQKGLASARALYPPLHAKPSVIVPHGHYRDAFPPPQPRARARAALGLDDRFTFLFFGSIRRYKNVPHLIETFRRLNATDVRLIVAGRPVLGMRSEDLRAIAADDERILLHLEFVPDERLALYLSAADKVVIPFDSVLNSGSVMLALSMNRSVIAPRLGALPELQAHVGRKWLHLYEGQLTPDILFAAMRDPLQPTEDEQPDLSYFDWDAIARTTLHFYCYSEAPESLHAERSAAVPDSSTR